MGCRKTDLSQFTHEKMVAAATVYASSKPRTRRLAGPGLICVGADSSAIPAKRIIDPYPRAPYRR
jgi:hypothetical protein